MSVQSSSIKSSAPAKKKIVYDYQARIKQENAKYSDGDEDDDSKTDRLCCKETGLAFLLPIILASGAFYLSYRSHLWCDYFVRDFVAYDTRYPFLIGEQQHLSMFSFQSALDGACYNYDELNASGSQLTAMSMEVDTSLRSARAFSLCSVVLGGVLLIMLWLSPCLTLPKGVRAGMAVMLFLNAAFESMVMLLLLSPLCDPEFGVCRLAFGSYLGISAAAAWFLASTAFLCLTIRNSRKKVNDKKKKQQQGDGTISTLTDGAANI